MLNMTTVDNSLNLDENLFKMIDLKNAHYKIKNMEECLQDMNNENEKLKNKLNNLIIIDVDEHHKNSNNNDKIRTPLKNNKKETVNVSKNNKSNNFDKISHGQNQKQNHTEVSQEQDYEYQYKGSHTTTNENKVANKSNKYNLGINKNNHIKNESLIEFPIELEFERKGNDMKVAGNFIKAKQFIEHN